VKLRKKASGDVDDYPDEEATNLLARLPMLYEAVEDGKPAESYKTRDGGARHKRKDLRAEG
jgi:hypothetical protein